MTKPYNLVFLTILGYEAFNFYDVYNLNQKGYNIIINKTAREGSSLYFLGG